MYIYIYIYICVCVYVWMGVSVCVCVLLIHSYTCIYNGISICSLTRRSKPSSKR